MKYRCALIADIHQNVLEGLRGLLETMFEAVVMVADADSLFEAAEKLKPDLTVVDISMPGKEVAIFREMQTRFPEIRSIALSVHDEEPVVASVMSSGASGYVLKRCAATDLIPAAEKVLSGGRYISPDLLNETNLS